MHMFSFFPLLLLLQLLFVRTDVLHVLYFSMISCMQKVSRTFKKLGRTQTEHYIDTDYTFGEVDLSIFPPPPNLHIAGTPMHVRTEGTYVRTHSYVRTARGNSTQKLFNLWV